MFCRTPWASVVTFPPTLRVLLRGYQPHVRWMTNCQSLGGLKGTCVSAALRRDYPERPSLISCTTVGGNWSDVLRKISCSTYVCILHAPTFIADRHSPLPVHHPSQTALRFRLILYPAKAPQRMNSSSLDLCRCRFGVHFRGPILFQSRQPSSTAYLSVSTQLQPFKRPPTAWCILLRS